MRDIKFRAWDGEQFVSPDFITREGVAWWKENSIQTSSKIIDQFTGLRDKNGKEIYEGDIADVYGGNNQYEIMFYRGGFYCALLPRKIRLYAVGESLMENIGIIGNVHENPELLK